MTIPTPASHPRTCRICHGDGWQPGPPIPAQHHGQPFNYQTVQPCRHVWWDDDPDTDDA